ncbi:MAG: alpha/beta hydrolase [Calditrichia bacterium]
MRPTFDEVVYSTLHLVPPAEQKEIYAQLVYESGRAASEIGLWLLDPKGASRVDEKNVTCPVLVISGTEDRIVPSSVVRKVAKKYEMVSTYREFEHHAHWVVGEPDWQEITDYIYQWLKQTSGG